MEFADFVAYTKEYGKKDADLLIIVPAFASYENVQRHLECLERQAYRKFNALLVLGVPFEDERLQRELEKKKFHFGIIIAKENERRGCSGGFFAGQKYSLENGYRYVIMADDDCMPVDPKLVEKLYENREKRHVTCRVHFVADGHRKAAHVSGPSQYSLYDVEIFKKYGLYYLPLFHGADDGEYMERVGEKSFQIENFAEHPYNLGGKKLFALFDRSWLFLLQSLVIMKSVKSLFYNLAQFVLLMSISLFFLPKYGRRLFSIMTRLLLTFTYGKRAHEGIKTGYEESVVGKEEAEGEKFETMDERDAKYIDGGIAGKAFGILGVMLGAVRKNVIVLNTYSFFKVFFLCVVARKVYVKLDEGKYLLLGSNRNALAHLLKLVCFAVFLPAYAILVLVLFIPIKIVKQPKTLRYGLD